MHTVKVDLGERSYPIYIGKGLLDSLGKRCIQVFEPRRCAVITDSNVEKLYAGRAIQSLANAGFSPFLITLPAGEVTKNLRFVESCYNRMAQERVERRSFVVALGGGVIGDLAGFVAATYMRGIGFVQVPTSLLAQVDSSVGGKVGVNLKYGKNLVGAFYQPKLVICDTETLTTLPDRELLAGISEVIKYAVIYDDALFKRLEREIDRLISKDHLTLSAVIARCCKIKAEVVAADETESGLRAILNFGHTVGHALESITGYGKYLHGEAVAIGQVAEAIIGTLVLNFKPADAQRIKNLIEKSGLPVAARLTTRERKRLIEAMKLDKKVSAGEIRFVLPIKIGKVKYGQKVPIEIIEKALEQISECQQ
ncbi:MAG: 3-dehydroquinate synthase [Verrucomicrobiia bacterium]|jgi:3-dehydroquinate synthase